MESSVRVVGLHHSTSLPNLVLDSKSCVASEIWIIPELAASPTVHGREIRHFFSILSSESGGTSIPPDISPSQSDILNVNNYRYKVLYELYESEKTYVCNLDTILTTFLPALAHAMSYEELRRLVPFELEVLLQRHTGLLAELREQATSPAGMIGEIFCKLCSRSDSDLLSIYCTYFNDFATVMETLVKYEKSLAFCEALQLCQQQPHCQGLSLSSFLLTPVQRLPRYELLLKEILKHTPKEHADWKPLDSALQLLRTQMLLLNKSIRSCQMSCLMGRSGTRRSARSSRRRYSGPQRVVGDLFRHPSQTAIGADIRPSQRRTLSHNVLNFSFGTVDSNGEDPHSPTDSLTISCSDLTLDFKDTSPSCNEDCARDDGVTRSLWSHGGTKQKESFLTSQPRITIGSPMQFRHVKHAVR